MVSHIHIPMMLYWISYMEEAWRRQEQDPCALSHCVSRCFHVVTDDPVLDYPMVLSFELIGIIMNHEE